MSKRVVSKANTLTRCGHGRLRTDCGFCARDDEIGRLRTELERTRQAWVNGDDPMCEDVCQVTCKHACGVDCFNA